MYYIKTIIATTLDFLLPQNELDKRIAAITAEELVLRISRKQQIVPEIALFDYSDELVKRMIWSLKYRKSAAVAQKFAAVLVDYLIEELADLGTFSSFTDPLIIPIPLSQQRLKERGYNQVELLGKELVLLGGTSLGTFCVDILRKQKNTVPQTSLRDRRAREENVRGVFCVTAVEKIRDRNIILLDDVTTTGSTLCEARKVLLKAGARHVLMVALAH